MAAIFSLTNDQKVRSREKVEKEETEKVILNK
jgi:hypothetical protein